MTEPEMDEIDKNTDDNLQDFHQHELRITSCFLWAFTTYPSLDETSLLIKVCLVWNNFLPRQSSFIYLT